MYRYNAALFDPFHRVLTKLNSIIIMYTKMMAINTREGAAEGGTGYSTSRLRPPQNSNTMTVGPVDCQISSRITSLHTPIAAVDLGKGGREGRDGITQTLAGYCTFLRMSDPCTHTHPHTRMLACRYARTHTHTHTHTHPCMDMPQQCKPRL